MTVIKMTIRYILSYFFEFELELPLAFDLDWVYSLPISRIFEMAKIVNGTNEYNDKCILKKRAQLKIIQLNFMSARFVDKVIRCISYIHKSTITALVKCFNQIFIN
jgi:hypothetical protein